MDDCTGFAVDVTILVLLVDTISLVVGRVNINAGLDIALAV